MQTTYRTMDEIRIHTTKRVAENAEMVMILTQFGEGFTLGYGIGGWSDAVGVVTEGSATILVMSADRSNLVNIAKLVAGYAIHDLGESEVWVRLSWTDDVMVFSR